MRFLGVSVTVLGTAAAQVAHANEPFNHDGFQFRAAVGAGYMSDSESASDGSFGGKISGVVPFALEIYLGGAPRPGWTFGGAFSMSGVSGPSVSFHSQSPIVGTPPGFPGLALSGLGPYFDWYPDSHGGFHALGMGTAVLVSVADGQISTGLGTGFALGAGLGYDWWLHKKWSVGVLARFTYAWPTTWTQYGDLTSVDNHIASAGLFFSIVYQ
jgi:hypothetical protein